MAAIPGVPGTAPVNMSGWTTAGNFGVAPEPTGPTFNMQGPASVPGAKTPPTFNFKAAAQMAGTAAAIGRYAVGILGPIGTGMAVYALAKELGFTLGKNPDDSVKVTKADPNVCTVAPCYAYSTRTWANVATNPTYLPTAAQACERARADIEANVFPNARPVATTACDGPSGYTEFRTATGVYYTQGNGWGLARVDAAAVDAANAQVAAQMQDFVDAIANKSGWPSSSAIAQATRDAMASGQTVPVGPTTVTGPPTADGGTVDKTNPDGTRESTKTTYNFNYAGDTVNITKTETTNYYNSSNVQTGTTTKTTDKPDPQTDQCKQNPDAAGCRDLDVPASETMPKQTKTVTYAPETVNVAWGSGCPAPISIGTFAGSSRSLDFAPFCDVATRSKPFILAAAAFAAMLIVLYGVRGTT